MSADEPPFGQRSRPGRQEASHRYVFRSEPQGEQGTGWAWDPLSPTTVGPFALRGGQTPEAEASGHGTITC